MMENRQIIDLIRKELPGIIQRNSEMREWFLQLTRETYADKKETESRFDRILNELRCDREENTRKWEEQNRKWEANQKHIEEQIAKWKEQDRKWEANQKHIEEQIAKWKGQDRKWDEQNRKWEANHKEICAMVAAIEAQARKHDSSIGALGSRWGLYSEQSFRNGLKAILEKSFGVEVLNINEYDESGEVFGHPDQVELDVIIQDGMLILCELKSSISKSEIYTFEKKTLFYEKRHNRKASRKLVISPMVDDLAKQAARKLGIEVYTHADDVAPTAP
jgi:hypothetical protein